MAGRPEGVGPTGLDLLRQMEAGALREATPSVAFGDISPTRGEIGSFRAARYGTRSIVSVVFSTQMKQQLSHGWSLSGPTPAEMWSWPLTHAP